MGEDKDLIELMKKERAERLKKAVERMGEEYSSACSEKANFSGMTLVKGDIIEIMLKGRSIKDVLVAEFECLNPYYAVIKVNTSEYEMIIKLRDVKFIRRKKRAST